MERDSQEILKKLEEKNIPVYSFSRLECINNCLYEAYQSYVLDNRDIQINNIYANLGGKCHDVLEGITKGTNTTKDLLPALQEEINDMDMLGIEFPKGRDGTDIIRQGYIADMTHFCKTYVPPKGQFEAETFFLYETPKKNYVQGYIDLTKKHKNGEISIYDYKTSALYKGDDIKKHGRQLVLYALGKEQQGYKVKEIGWIFLKYCEVTYVGKKTSRSKEETEITKVIERKNIIKDLASVIEGKLQKYGVNEIDIEIIMDEAYERNTIPEILACEFKVKPYLLKYELSDETRQDCIDYIDDTIERWESMDSSDERNYPPLAFTQKNKKGEDRPQLFYHWYLCGYSKMCPHFKRFMETYQSNNEDEDLW